MKTYKELSCYTKSELHEIYDTLNSWEWDERVGTKPSGFDELPDYNYKWYHKLLKRRTKADYIEPAMARVSQLLSKENVFK